MNKKNFNISQKILLICLSFFLCQITFSATTLEAKNQELQSVNKKIQGLTHTLTQAQTQRQTVELQLKPIEISIGKIANRLTNTNNQLQQEKNILSQLDQQHQMYQQRLQQQQFLLTKQLCAAYMLGQHQYLKLLLNQNQPHMVARLLVYYHYINAARIKIINDLTQTLNDLVNNQNQIETQSAQYATSLQQEQRQQTAIQQQYKQRQLVLAELTQKIDTKSKRLSQLKANQSELQGLINKLKEQSFVIVQPKVPFAEMKGRLPWPVHGSITRNFGSAIDSSDTVFNGTFISAPIGQPIKAVYPGKVVFADWLGGVGLLIIIQHDKDYMTLYGHAHSMLVKVGEYVRQGQEIGTVGQSGGSENSGLFFQIRHEGTPINPDLWCR